jgi:MoaA/NifB/PqqE/SkfB family radical SAM enzyme
LLDKIRELIASWAISIDAATEETYGQVRGGDWNMLLKGLEYIKTFNCSKNFRFVVQKNNYHDTY